MTDKSSDDPKPRFEILYGLFTHLGAMIQNEENQGEKRITFFLTLVTASLALIAFLGEKVNLAYVELPWVFRISLIILIVFGIETQIRLTWRAINIRFNSYLQRRVLDALGKIEPSIEFIEANLSATNTHRKKSGSMFHTLRGSPSEFMYLINGLLCSGLATTFFYEMCTPRYCGFLLGIACGTVYGILLRAVFRRVRDKLNLDAVNERH